jgi:hypothetical protein
VDTTDSFAEFAALASVNGVPIGSAILLASDFDPVLRCLLDQHQHQSS